LAKINNNRMLIIKLEKEENQLERLRPIKLIIKNYG